MIEGGVQEMSRSFRKTPIFGMTTSPSEKQDKKIWHSRARATERDRLKAGVDDNHLTTLDREVSNPWSFDKDGKTYWASHDKKSMRK